jgi:hypothetical protein
VTVSAKPLASAFSAFSDLSLLEANLCLPVYAVTGYLTSAMTS